jgi:hypothetical protein
LLGRYGLAGAGLALLTAAMLSQVFAIRYVKELIEKPFSGIGGSLLAMGISTLAGSAISILIIQKLSGMPALVLAGLFGPLTIALTILYIDRVFKLGLLSRIAEPFPMSDKIHAKCLSRLKRKPENHNDDQKEILANSETGQRGAD